MPINLDSLNNIKKKLQAFNQEIDLMAVTKNRSKEDVMTLMKNEIKIFGENRVQEAQQKFNDLFAAETFSLHLIGPLQTNKVKDALKIFHSIQSIDRIKLVDEISKFIHQDYVKTSNFYIQVNIGNEKQKSGVSVENLEPLYQYSLSKNLNIKGLMCIPPASQDATPYFEEMNMLRDKLDSHLKLSMGMSTDYDLALALNTNLIRLGSILFND